MAFKSDITTLVLASLQSGPKHGYLIAKYIRHQSDDVLIVGESAIYPVLQDLEEKEFVTSEWEIQDGRPPRKSYSITQSGLAEIEKQRTTWNSFVKSVNSIFGSRVALEEDHA